MKSVFLQRLNSLLKNSRCHAAVTLSG